MVPCILAALARRARANGKPTIRPFAESELTGRAPGCYQFKVAPQRDRKRCLSSSRFVHPAVAGSQLWNSSNSNGRTGLIRSRWGSLILLVAVTTLLVHCSSGGITQNPTPVIVGIFPQSITAGSEIFNISITGFGATFISTSVALWNGVPRKTTFDTSTGHLQVTILAADVTNPGVQLVSVMNPSPGGGFSAQSASFQVLQFQNGAPTNISLDPANANVGTQGPFKLTVNGMNFVADSIVRVNGSFRQVNSATATALTTDLTTADLATAGLLSVSVDNPLPGGIVASSISVDFTVGSAKGPSPAGPLNARNDVRVIPARSE